MLTLLALGSVSLAGDILLNEVVYDPDGTDGGQEWIELCNAGTETVDLTDWIVEVTGTSGGSGVWKESYVFGDDMLAPGEYLYVGPAMDTGEEGVTFSPNIPNATSYTSGIRLVMSDGSSVSDTLLYGDSTNTYLFEDDEGDTDQFAGDATKGDSLYRWPDCTDTGDSGVDFGTSESPTPGFENEEDMGGGDDGGSDGGGDCSGADDGLVVINELVNDPSGSDGDADGEWVELYNADSVAIDLSGWTIAAGTSSFSDKVTLSGMIEPGQYLVVGEANAPVVDILVEGTFGMGNAGSNADGVQLRGCMGYTDTVIYGEINEDEWPEDSGELATSLAPKPSEGTSIGRATDGADTDVSGDDFVALDFKSPGAPNDEEPTCEGSEDVKINEFMPDPEGTDDGLEWVELHNTGSVAVDLTDWMVRKATSTSSATDYALPEGTSIEAGGFLLIGASLVEGADVTFGDDEDESELSFGNASSNADAVMLVHCGGVVSDTVIYGNFNEDEFTDDTDEVVVDQLAPKPEGGLSLARCGDGTDSNDSSLDFWIPDTATPGEANVECVPPVCEGGSLTIKVNEFLANPAGADGGQDWIELYNAGDSDQVMDQWVIETAKSSWSELIEFPGGTTLGAGEFMLIGGADVPAEARDFEAKVDLGTASTAPDGVRLIDCEGTLQDTVLWGEDEDLGNELYDDADEQSMVVPSSEGFSMGRYPDGADSDDNSVDLETNMPQTPGRANEQSGSDSGGGGDGGVSKGCSKRNDDASEDGASKSCAVASPVGAWAWMLGALVMVRRRR